MAQASNDQGVKRHRTAKVLSATMRGPNKILKLDCGHTAFRGAQASENWVYCYECPPRD